MIGFGSNKDERGAERERVERAMETAGVTSASMWPCGGGESQRVCGHHNAALITIMFTSDQHTL